MIQQRALWSKMLPAFALAARVSLGSILLTAVSAFARVPAEPAFLAIAAGQAAAPTPSVHSDSANEAFADTRHEDASSPLLHLAIGRSLVLTTKMPLKRIYVGNPAVLQSYNAGPEEVVLTAKAYGVSSLVLWDTTGHSHMYTVSAEMDCDAVRAAFKATFPESHISVDPREGKLVLSGDVPSDAVSEAAGKMALAYSKEIINGLRVVAVHGKQVQLKLRIIEVDRTKADQFGINIFGPQGGTVGSTSTQQFTNVLTVTPATANGPATVAVSDPFNLFLYNFKNNIGATIKDLESKQILQILAEPTLTTVSGNPARFLSGGEFPVPIVQGGTGNSTAITIVYKPFGVKVDFTPTVNRDGTIRLKVSPEVSTLDYANAITLSGTTVPALATRRAETEVEIRDGQSFVLTGLLDHRTTDSLSNTPGISSIPILGQLFRSKNLNRSVTELVVMVTATVVDPLAPGDSPATPEMVVPNLDKNDFDKVFRPLIKNGNATAKTPVSQPVASPPVNPTAPAIAPQAAAKAPTSTTSTASATQTTAPAITPPPVAKTPAAQQTTPPPAKVATNAAAQPVAAKTSIAQQATPAAARTTAPATTQPPPAKTPAARQATPPAAKITAPAATQPTTAKTPAPAATQPSAAKDPAKAATQPAAAKAPAGQQATLPAMKPTAMATPPEAAARPAVRPALGGN